MSIGFEKNKEIFMEMRKAKRTYGHVSRSWLQCHFKMSFVDAKKTLQEFEDSIIQPVRKNGKFAKKE